MNWKYKAILQAILSIIPFGESINYRLQLAIGSHNISNIDKVTENCITMLKALLENGFQNISNKKIVEIGTGWQLTFPIVLSLLGAKRIFTYDHVQHIRFEQVKNTLARIKKNLPLISKSLRISINELEKRSERIIIDKGLTGLLESLNIEYFAPGNATHTKLADNSLDLFFSYAVLEHLPEQTIVDITKEAFRSLKPGSFYYNLIGLHDHYIAFDKTISRINFLKYPESSWKLIAKNKITYLNRVRNSQFVKIIKDCGFKILKINTHIDKESLIELKNMKLAKKFRDLKPEDLAIDRTEIIARKPKYRGFSWNCL